MRPALSLAWIATALLCGCGSDPMAGNSIETENAVAVRVLRVDSLLPSWARPDTGATVATLRLGADFDFRTSSASGLDLSVERLDSVGLPFESVVWDSAAGRGRLHVRLDKELQRPGARIRLRWGLSPARRADPQATWAGIPASLRERLTSLLVDDFETGSLANRLPWPSRWYASASESCSVSAPQLVTGSHGRSGTSLAVTYQAPVANNRFALVGTLLGPAARSLRSLDSLVFWTRGSGILSVSFDHLRNDTGYKAWTQIQLDTGWTRVRVRPQDLAKADGVGYNVGWNSVRDSVTNLSFILNGGSSFGLDDVRFFGIDQDDLK